MRENDRSTSCRMHGACAAVSVARLSEDASVSRSAVDAEHSTRWFADRRDGRARGPLLHFSLTALRDTIADGSRFVQVSAEPNDAVLGRYRLLVLLGQGGMADVYL